jgi:hypothetical protein
MNRIVKTIAISFLVATLAAFAAGVAAQSAGQTTEPSPGMMGRGMMGQGMMGPMMSHHQQMSELMNKLTQSMAALESEKDPAALKSKLAEHRALLEQMRTQMTQQSGMMQRMAAQAGNCPMMGEGNQPSAK